MKGFAVSNQVSEALAAYVVLVPFLLVELRKCLHISWLCVCWFHSHGISIGSTAC